jgi:hypothetical protein
MSQFIQEYVLWFAPIFSFIVAQLLKYVVYAVQYRVLRKERLTGAGGMPSSHSSGVCTLITVMALEFGTQSAAFAISLIFGLVVMYDAAGVRRAAGVHAKVINVLKTSIDELDNINNEKENSENKEETNKETNKEEDKPNNLSVGDPRHHKGEGQPLKEFVGHTPLEVLIGAILGIALGFMFVS